MIEIVRRVIESTNSDQIAELFGKADQASRDCAVDTVLDLWANQNLDRKTLMIVWLMVATGFAKCRDYSRGCEVARMLAERSRECGDQEMLDNALGTLGLMLMETGNMPEARRTFEEIIASGLSDSHVRVRSLHNLGIIESREGRSENAIARFEDALEVARLSGDLRMMQMAKASADNERQALAHSSCPPCRGKGLIFKDGYGLVVCPECQGSGTTGVVPRDST